MDNPRAQNHTHLHFFSITTVAPALLACATAVALEVAELPVGLGLFLKTTGSQSWCAKPPEDILLRLPK